MKISQLDKSEQSSWLRKLLEVLIMRRGGMFGLIEQYVRMLLLGNGSGIAMILGTVKLSGQVDTHWSSMVTLVTFIAGALFAALSYAMVTGVSMKEAHNAELALHQFVNDEIEYKDVLFFKDSGTIDKLVRYSAYFGVSSAVCLILGMIQGVIQVCIYF